MRPEAATERSKQLYRAIYIRPMRNAMRDQGYDVCVGCGYPLTGLGDSGKCPECGWEVTG